MNTPPKGVLNRLDRTLRYTALWLGLTAVALFSVVAGVLIGRRPELVLPQNQLRVTVLNVGHGEASWVKTPGGKFIVLGTGGPGQGRTVTDSLKAAGAEKIDLFILPYPYAEAIGGAPAIIEEFPIEQAREPGGPVVNQWQAQVRTALGSKGVPIRLGRAGEMLEVDGVMVEILAPAEPLLQVTPASPNNSLVVRLRYRKTAFLWAGGIEEAGEQALIARTPDLNADWLRVSRFGTRNASSPEFLRLVMPEFVVLSAGANREGLPHQETLDRLEATGAHLYRTDSLSGPLNFTSDGTLISMPSY